MLFNSYLYPAFLALTACCFWMFPVKARAWFLIVAGILFYASHAIPALVIIGGLSLFTFAVGHSLLNGGLRKSFVWLPILFIVLLFALFKYESLGIQTFNSLFGTTISLPDILMPLGISFFVFEFIHYLTDIKRGGIGHHSLKEFLAFSFFFPTMVSGPIKRFEQFRESLRAHAWRPEMFYKGGLLIVLGYVQKYVLADPLVPFTTELAEPVLLQTTAAAAGGLFFYSLRIYFDFAGLSNIAIGSALLFGILVPKNFDNPYLRPNIQQFWNHWHMSLSSWVRDYIYITLGGSRRGQLMTLLNLTAAMLVVGIWHGASWNFAVWGLYHGVGLCVHRLWNKAGLSFGQSWIGKVAGALLTFIFVTIGWAFFVTNSLSESMVILRMIFPFLQ